MGSINAFESTLERHQVSLRRGATEILQLNVGKLCNLTCSHCHVNAGPNRKEVITRETVDHVLEWFERSNIPTLDITGGSPEMVPDFRYIVEQVRQFDRPREVMDRLNATILMEPGFEDLPEFFAEHQVELIASMPCYSPDNVNAQRGDGVFDASITAFQKLNEVGYGKDRDLKLHFVYNPGGDFLPPDQQELEEDYRREMKKHFGIEFNSLYALANMPIARFASYLKREKRYHEYLTLLKEAFNPATIEGLMCRNTINVSWLGHVYDCDFNQMLELPLEADEQTNGELPHLWDFDPESFEGQDIRTGVHCFGCTAGSGSSCGGALV